ncbi:metallophosphoesterase family protein [Actinospica sp. MGRD01-02]|uniref:Metallophosphoesterase family protein n=1 Tax=Actinospica acidithermotolerans TaxID=2828514 RepID=A0A941ILM3_9ACTN|nr:metallophosphoesterase family protein [Actinospica acidithermotolerans]MBR7827756.1 metallophosphoesterase family protein [Actinospica acidithermotolerans]
MGDCCTLSRRQILSMATAGAAAGFLIPGAAMNPAQAAAAKAAGVYPQDLELVTVTDDGFVLTWYTATGPAPAIPFQPSQEPAAVATDGYVRYGTDPDRLDCVAVQRGGETAYHHVEVTGLRPGTTYYYQAFSAQVQVPARQLPELTYPAGGVVLPADPTDAQLLALLGQLLSSGVVDSAAPGSVTTLVPPRGRHLFTIALANDLHIGETVSGLVIANFPPGFEQPAGLPPYPVVMTEAMTQDAARLGAHALLVAGDISSAALSEELIDSKQLLDKFGPLRLGGELGPRGYVVARGNHDQPKTGSAYETCAAVDGASGFFDCLPAVYDLPQGTLTQTELGGMRFIGLDTTTLDTPSGAIDDAQFEQLTEVLGQDPERPTLVFGHHPVTDEAALTTIAGPGFDLDRADATRLEALYAATPGVFFHHSGHTHRNRRTSSPTAANVEFLEVAATKEYPGGFALLKVYEGGYTVNFHKSSTAPARQWSQTSSGEYLGLYPAYTLGTAADRNHVVGRDFSGLRRLPRPGL